MTLDDQRYTLKTKGRAELLLTIELTRGSNWQEPAETIDCRDCDTDSIEFAAAEALHWLGQTQKNAPAPGGTPFPVVAGARAALGRPPRSAATALLRRKPG